MRHGLWYRRQDRSLFYLVHCARREERVGESRWSWLLISQETEIRQWHRDSRPESGYFFLHIFLRFPPPDRVHEVVLLQVQPDFGQLRQPRGGDLPRESIRVSYRPTFQSSDGQGRQAGLCLLLLLQWREGGSPRRQGRGVGVYSKLGNFLAPHGRRPGCSRVFRLLFQGHDDLPFFLK